ncbi:hypothetical protein HOP52_18415 [Halomonas campisalis]|uniref:DUF4136 domain-containing protein n=1 Tax=Billgrantia campisalis TaxID=74661 RepID=A0ABS9PD84_9GAMM|nr:hypothetical protein [Halomonas campisalis]MCG6659727.1 hypothetical protein [Halomonas campisalis]MDR5864639.1 hypothetical protein [Halomonas campisalis]
MRPWWPMPILLVLAGCETTPSALPAAEPSPAAECRWEAGEVSSVEWVRRAAAVFEGEGYEVRHTDPALGVISVERRRRVPGYGDPYDSWSRPTWFGSYGVGRGGGFSTGVMVGFGSVGYMRGDATRLERVSLVADGQAVRISRDIQVIDWQGDQRESRSASDADYCRQLREALERVDPREAS